MDSLLNHNNPLIMHIDLNSCFATIEQQANSHLRGKPLVIAAYTSPGGCILASSIEAKKLGIKTGMRVRDAKLIFKDVIVRDPDPVLVRDVHTKFKNICRDYSPIVIPKSIDEVVIDFKDTPAFTRGLKNIGKEIKQRFRDEIGEWISCNIGISTNRFLAKLAASLHKPDGLDIIDYKNLRQIYSSVKLTDLNGINTRFQARLNAYNIFTPIDFLEAEERVLRKQVFKSIVGHYWYLKLRGFETDDAIIKRKSFGQEYSLAKKTNNKEEITKIIMKLCEKMGRRLRGSLNAANGIHIGLIYDDWTFWHQGRHTNQPVFTTQELYTKALLLYNDSPTDKNVSKLSVSCYDLTPLDSLTLSLFEIDIDKKRKVSKALDEINDYYGEYVITPASMMDMNKVIVDRIAFGGVAELEDIYC